MNTNTAIKSIAYSTKANGNLVLPAGVNLIQRRTNLQPHRKLSRITVSSESTPIWQQQILRPSTALQQRFGQKEEPAEYIKSSVSLTPDLPHAPLPIIQEPYSSPVKKTQPKESIPPIPAVIPQLQPVAEIVQEPDDPELTTPLVSIPEPFTESDVTSVQPSYISNEIEQKLLETVDKKDGVVKPNTHAQLNATLQQLEETLTNIDNDTMADLSISLEQITGLRNKIQEQEQKLKQLNANTSSEDLEADMKTKKALLDNLQHALDNTQIELAELEKEPNADTGLISQMKEQLAQQKRSFDQLQREHKELLGKKNITPDIIQLPKQSVPATSTNQPTAAASAPKITSIPNAINGTVTDPAGKLITGAVVIIKTAEGRPLRALKTNQLGQFWVTTALENGSYLVETEAPNLSFDTVAVELTGDVVQPITIAAK